MLLPRQTAGHALDSAVLVRRSSNQRLALLLWFSFRSFQSLISSVLTLGLMVALPAACRVFAIPRETGSISPVCDFLCDRCLSTFYSCCRGFFVGLVMETYALLPCVFPESQETEKGSILSNAQVRHRGGLTWPNFPALYEANLQLLDTNN